MSSNRDESTDENMANAAQLLQKAARPIINFIFEAIPVVISSARRTYNLYQRLPTEYAQLIIGLVMCFFGGIYPTVFAAIQVSHWQPALSFTGDKRDHFNALSFDLPFELYILGRRTRRIINRQKGSKQHW